MTLEALVTAAIVLLILGAALFLSTRKGTAREGVARPVEGVSAFPNFRIATRLDTIFLDSGISSGFDPAILKGIARQESNLGQFRTGPSGELGLMQIHPVNFKRRPDATPEDWRTNDLLSVTVATEILGDARRRFGDNPELYLAAYNWGETRLNTHLSAGGSFNTIPNVVQEYVSHVLSFARSFGASVV